jgi:hypothetical protein
MSLREIDYTGKKLWDLRGAFEPQPFAAMDPGLSGAVVVYERIGLTPGGLIERPVAVFPLALPLEAIAVELVKRGVRLVFVESQHQKKNTQSVLKLARRAAYLPAFLAGMVQPEEVTAVWLHPASWQTVLRVAEGKKRLAAGEAKELALQYAGRIFGGDGRWTGATKSLRSGIADATMIALWAQRVVWMPQEVRTGAKTYSGHARVIPLFGRRSG